MTTRVAKSIWSSKYIQVLFILLQELGIKNHFHKKKLQLALQAMSSEKRSLMDELDYNWVTRKCVTTIITF